MNHEDVSKTVVLPTSYSWGWRAGPYEVVDGRPRALDRRGFPQASRDVPSGAISTGTDLQLWLSGYLDAQRLAGVGRRVAVAIATGTNRIVVGIDSPGGDLTPSLRLYDYLRSCGVMVTTWNLGEVGLAAFNIFAAGTVRACTPMGRFLLHELTRFIPTPAERLQITRAFLAEETALLDHDCAVTARIVAEVTGTSVGDAAELLRSCTVWDAETAKLRGVVTTIDAHCFDPSGVIVTG